MKALALSIAVLLFAAGCASNTDEGDGTGPGPTTTPPVPVQPREVLNKEGTCDLPATEPKSFDFKVDPDYDQLLIDFHPAGTGKAALEIKTKSGSPVYSIPEETYEGVPCAHGQHTPGATKDISPGNYTATATATGAIGWTLVLTEKSSKGSNNTTSSHGHTHAPN